MMNIRKGVRLAVTAGLALVGGAALAQAPAPSCARTTPELEKALDAVHAARDGSADESARVVERWLPKATKVLASDRKVSQAWLHLAVDLARELMRLERATEARPLLSRVVKLDPDGDWGRKAAAHIEKLDGHTK